MLKEELLRRKSQLENEVGALQLKIEPLEEELRKKREMLQHIVRLVELEDGSIAGPYATGAELSGVNASPSSASQFIPIFVDYNSKRYDAQLDRSRINGDSGHCVLFRGQWMTASAAANNIPTQNNTNGWRFWKYCRNDGTTGTIDELRTHG